MTVHWNGNYPAAISIRTTGPSHCIHEIIEIALVPLDNNLNIVKRPKILPFHQHMIPNRPEFVDEVYMAKMKTTIRSDVYTSGAILDLLEKWYDKLDLGYDKFGNNRCRLLLVGYDLHNTIPFLQEWLGDAQISDFFHPDVIDIRSVANYINDKAAIIAEPVMFAKRKLKYLQSTLQVPKVKPYDTLQEAVVIGEIYRRMASLRIH